MTDSRPRPQYGEYATPEEQADAVGTVPAAMQDITPQAVVAPPAPAVAGRQPRRWDLIITILLLAMGAYVTVSNFAAFGDMATFFTQFFAIYGYDGALPDLDRAAAVGLALNIVHPVVLIAVAFLASRVLRAGRVAFWIPLVAGVVLTILTASLILVLAFSDPAFVEFIQQQYGG